VIENEYLRVEVSTEDGSLVLFDRRSAIEFSGLHRFVDGGDCGDEYNFCPPDSDRLVRLAFVDSVRIEKDAVQQTIDISLHMRLPAELSQDRKSRSKTAVVVPIFSRIRLSSGVPRLEITTTVDNLNPNGEARARDHRLRVHFQAPFTVQQADYDGHFEIVRRKVGVPVFDQSWVEQPRPEKPQRLFTAITGEQAGLAIANRGLPEVEVFTNAGGRSEIALTLLRCVGWLSRDDFASRHGHAGPALPTPGAQMAGRYTFNYSVIPYPAASPLSDVYAQATAFNAPLRGFIEPLHPGVLPPSSSLVGAEPAQFAISAIKPCEDGSGWIVRGYNLGSAPLDARLRPWKPFPHAGRVALSEQPISSLETAADGSVTFPVGGHEIVTIKFTD
jgi:alpha-mannosidase